MKIVGTLILLIALIKLRTTPLWGTFLTVASIGILSFYNGIELDFKNYKYRNTITLCPQKIGNWQPLPKLEYISVFRAIMVATATGYSGTSISKKFKVIQVNLIHSKNKKIKLMQTLP